MSSDALTLGVLGKAVNFLPSSMKFAKKRLEHNDNHLNISKHPPIYIEENHLPEHLSQHDCLKLLDLEAFRNEKLEPLIASHSTQTLNISDVNTTGVKGEFGCVATNICDTSGVNLSIHHDSAQPLQDEEKKTTTVLAQTTGKRHSSPEMSLKTIFTHDKDNGFVSRELGLSSMDCFSSIHQKLEHASTARKNGDESNRNNETHTTRFSDFTKKDVLVNSNEEIYDSAKTLNKQCLEGHAPNSVDFKAFQQSGTADNKNRVTKKNLTPSEKSFQEIRLPVYKLNQLLRKCQKDKARSVSPSNHWNLMNFITTSRIKKSPRSNSQEIANGEHQDKISVENQESHDEESVGNQDSESTPVSEEALNTEDPIRNRHQRVKRLRSRFGGCRTSAAMKFRYHRKETLPRPKPSHQSTIGKTLASNKRRWSKRNGNSELEPGVENGVRNLNQEFLVSERDDVVTEVTGQELVTPDSGKTNQQHAGSSQFNSNATTQPKTQFHEKVSTVRDVRKERLETRGFCLKLDLDNDYRDGNYRLSQRVG
ncbi:hypothetical protein ElyMa_004177700 [Elysia marginata]|uniref:Shugoshin C-terminal domain-containing protein n=1 Tax=Elysia marginata TaxID=1093978 RepID=A0AAV4GJC8_9GAST|nr:hypothetical protein ElyMa_004177700 [Elysia marginata]